MGSWVLFFSVPCVSPLCLVFWFLVFPHGSFCTCSLCFPSWLSSPVVPEFPFSLFAPHVSHLCLIGSLSIQLLSSVQLVTVHSRVNLCFCASSVSIFGFELSPGLFVFFLSFCFGFHGGALEFCLNKLFFKSTFGYTCSSSLHPLTGSKSKERT